MTAPSGDPGETPQSGGAPEDFPAYEMPPDPAYGPPQAYGSYPPPPPPPGYGPPLSYPPPPAPPGYGPPPSPQYAPPFPGAAGYPGYPGYPPPAGTNTVAIVALVSSVLGLLCGFGSIVGIVLGLVAINQIKKTGQRGHGLAVSAIVVGVASLVLSIIMWTYARNMGI